ncbi:hypothetical protein SDC9_87433 [bioreactor metagenome]|uniref:Uncharacterized protein n=1 Tax=bioreactor metagenome TaxID=1076179 RepID=A0A644ZIR5_9ZZZZ
MQTKIHKNKGDEGRQPDSLADEPRLQDIADHGNNDIKKQNSHAMAGISAEQTHQPPGDQYGAGSQHGHNIHHRDKRGKDNSIFNAEQRKAQRQLAEGKEHEK